MLMKCLSKGMSLQYRGYSLLYCYLYCYVGQSVSEQVIICWTHVSKDSETVEFITIIGIQACKCSYITCTQPHRTYVHTHTCIYGLA